MTEKTTIKQVKETALVKKENEQLKGLEESKAAQIKAVFQPMVEMLESFEAKYKEVVKLEISPDKCKEAKRLRISIARVRIDADKVRKVQKEKSLREGKAIDGVNNILKFAVMDKEEKLKDIETHYERIEEAKKAQLQIDRVAELERYEADGEFVDLGNMPDDIWKNYLAGVKNNYESIKDAERKAEEDRIEAERIDKLHAERKNSIMDFWQFIPDEMKTTNFGMLTDEMFKAMLETAKVEKTDYDIEQTQIREDNERLRIENEKAEKKRLAEKKKADAKLKVEREKAEAARLIEQENVERERLEAEQKLNIEREAREKLEKEAKDKEAADQEEAERKAAEEKKALAAPDKEKLFSVATKLRNTKTTVKSTKAKKALEDAALLLEEVAEDM